MRRVEAGGVAWYESEPLAARGVRHAFSTRIGGVSGGPFASLNLGNPAGCPTPDPEGNVAENYQRLSSAAALPVERAWAFQVHGARVLDVRAGEAFECGREADGLVSDDPGRAVSIRTADCAAVLMCSADGRVIGAAHAGWRGVVADAVGATAARMREIGAPAVAGAVFPCISFGEFEVGPEVVAAFTGLGLRAEMRDRGKGRADVAGSCAEQLRRAGVREIDVSAECTVLNAADFFSHRRDRGLTGRMALLAAPAGEEGRS